MNLTSAGLRAEIERRLRVNFAVEPRNATKKQLFRASALTLRDALAERQSARPQNEGRTVHYLSMEFLLGRSLLKNAQNLGCAEALRGALAAFGADMNEVLEEEADAGLGNGGLGRLAACYMDSMTTLGICACGYSICYELGIFRQKLIDGAQAELPDEWLSTGESWLITRPDDAVEVRFGGRLTEKWGSGGMRPSLEGSVSVLAVPRDMLVSGWGTPNVNTLRLWDARSPESLDLSLFSSGQYMKSMEQRAMAEVIAKVLYPDDNHYEGRSLRLRQQYFFVSATVQDIVRAHMRRYGTLANFAEKHVLQINDTHPALVIPELMRVFMDEHGLGWDEAEKIVRRCCAYTNHTVLPEAQEVWPQALVSQLVPRVFQILCEMQRRLELSFGADRRDARELSIVWGGEVRMANLCLEWCFAVNGVSQLHGEILKSTVFRASALRTPEKFTSVTNGVDHRRWLALANPGLHALIREAIGDRYMKEPEALSGLERFTDDGEFLRRLEGVKLENKKRLARFLERQQGESFDAEFIVDAQAKRLHEYKRQLMNLMRVCALWDRLRDGGGRELPPRVFIFAAKAAPGYAAAKRIIRLINSAAAAIARDEACRGRLKVIFLENYRVTAAETLIPASELSQQISLAGKEASGTGNMKFMMNGALTMGTLDGANAEMHELLGDENMFLFGMDAAAAAARKSDYNPEAVYNRSGELRRVLDRFRAGFGDGEQFDDVVARLLFGASGAPADEYFLLEDFEAYMEADARAMALYREKAAWNAVSLVNIARSGFFAADRAAAEYRDRIWRA